MPKSLNTPYRLKRLLRLDLRIARGTVALWPAASRDIIGVNAARARLLLQAHELLNRCAVRHQLVSPGDAAQTEKELSRLRRKLNGLT